MPGPGAETDYVSEGRANQPPADGGLYNQVMGDRLPPSRTEQTRVADAAPMRRAEANRFADQWAFSGDRFPDAMQKAAAEGKPVVIKVGAEWCKPCQAMKNQTLTDASVQNNLKKNGVFVDVDADRNAQLAERLGVQSYPTTIIAALQKNAQGQVELKAIAQQSGYMNPDQFNKFMEQGMPKAEAVMAASGFTKRGDAPQQRGQERPVEGDRQQQRQEGPKEPEAQSRLERRPDGSALEYRRLADGKEHATNITFPDGSRIAYGYDKDGKPNHVREFDANGKETLDYQLTNGVNWFETQSRGIPLQGRLDIRPDGTHVFKDSVVGNTFVRTPNGAIQLMDSTGKVVFSKPGTGRGN